MKTDYSNKVMRGYNNKGQEGNGIKRELTCKCGRAVVMPNKDGLCPRCSKIKESEERRDS